jgi:Matrixin
MRPPCRRAAGLLAVAAMACGDEDRRPNTPTPVASPSPVGVAAGSVLTVVRGDSGAPVEGALVTVGGQTYVSDRAGTVRIANAAPPGALVDVTAPSVLDRQTVVRTGDAPRLALWPRTTSSGIDESFTIAIVYTAATLAGGPPGGEALQRHAPETQAVIVVPSTAILDDQISHAAHVTAVQRLTVAARGAITYALSRDRPSSGVVFDARLGPDPACGERVAAFARVRVRADVIIGGEIVYCSVDAARTVGVVVHEMGHTSGLRHSNDPRDVMFGMSVRNRAADLSAREADVMSLMMQRRAGNRFPDSDRGVAGSAVGEEIIVCR